LETLLLFRCKKFMKTKPCMIFCVIEGITPWTLYLLCWFIAKYRMWIWGCYIYRGVNGEQMNCYFLCPSHREASWYVSGGSPEWRRRPLPPPVLFDVCSSKLIRFFWWLPSESSLDSFPHVQAYYFAVGAGSPSSSRIRLFLSLEEPEEAAEAEEHRPYVDEVEEGALSLRKDDRCYHFLLYSTVRE